MPFMDGIAQVSLNTTLVITLTILYNAGISAESLLVNFWGEESLKMCKI